MSDQVSKDIFSGFRSPRDVLVQSEINEIAEERTGLEGYPRLVLFFSMDIVNSTVYKEMTASWPVIIRSLMEEIRKQVYKIPELEACILWRVIGDETVFVLPISLQKEIGDIVFAALKGIFLERCFDIVEKGVEDGDFRMKDVADCLGISSQVASKLANPTSPAS